MIHRFAVSPEAVRGERAVLEDGQAHQVAVVLRLRPGDRIALLVDGDEVEVSLVAVTTTRVEGTILARHSAPNEPGVRVTLAMPLLRGDRSEEVVEAAVQLGVARIVPFVSARSVVRRLSPSRLERWRRIARESAETARRGAVPEIGEVLSWGELLASLAVPIIVAWEGEGARRLAEVLREQRELSLVVGPEGGLSAEEVAQARALGALTVSLGRRNLRSETAAIAAVAVVMASLDRTGAAVPPPQ